MQSVQASNRLHDSVLKRADDERRAAPGETPAAAPRAFAVKRSRAKGFTIAACLVIVAGLGAAAFALNPFAAGPKDSPQTDNPAAATSDNFFTLVAYAAENPQAEPGKTVTLNADNFTLGSGGGIERNALTNEEYPDRYWVVQGFVFDVTCQGENIQSIEYAVEGNGAYFKLYDEEEFLRAHGVYGSDDPAVKSGYTESYDTSFSVDYTNQDMRANRISCTLNVPFHMGGRTRELWDTIFAADQSNADSTDSNPWSEFTTACIVDGAHQLAQSRIKMTATFTDGSTQTKSYVIAPVDNFEEAYRAVYLDAEPSEDAERPPLFTLTEIADE